MIPNADIEALAQHITNIMPSSIEVLRDESQKNLHAILQAWLAQLNLVTREEFDAQSAVLARTREKLLELEQVIHTMERRQAPPTSTT